MLRAKWFVLMLALLVAGAAQADIIINEIMQNPSAVSDADGEWFELYNDGATDVDIDGWTFDDLGSDSFTISGSVIVPAGGYIVLGNNADFATNGGVNVAYEYTGFNLSNSDDEVIAWDAGANEVDRVEYDGGPNWPDPSGASMQLVDPTMDNNDYTNWLEADLVFGDGDFGTPGAMNEWDQGGTPADTVDATIAEIQADPAMFQDDSLWVRVSGIITQGHDTIHNYYVDVFVQDASGYGIMMYSSDTTNGEGLMRGDEVEVIAQVDQYFDTTELIDFVWTELSTGNPQPAPVTFDTGVFDSQLDWEGTWCELQGTITSDPNLGGDFNFTIDDGTGDGTIRIYAAAGFDMSQYAIGDEIIVRGTIDTYSGSCQLQPSEIGDIEMVSQDPVDLDLTVTTDTVPAAGGVIYYDAHLVSNVGGTYPVRYMSEALAPNGNTYPVDNIPFTLQPFMDVTFTSLQINVPAIAPEGTYTFTGEVGAGPYWFGDSFDFYKTGAVEGGELTHDSFLTENTLVAGEDGEMVALPSTFSMSQAYPNPFNPTTSVAISLPEAAELNVTVFNVMGQQVATLANGTFNAGQHQLTFDGANLSSGLYFIQAQVPGQMNEIQKVTLMK